MDSHPNTQEQALATIDNPMQVNYNLKDAVKLPERENPEEWIALNLYDFNKQVRMLYGTLEEYCTNESCPRMSTGKKFEYLWSSGPTNEAPTAPQYIHHLLDWVQEQINDEEVFPVKEEARFPQDYMDVAETISKRLFRIYSHIYHHHSQDVRNLKEEAHMNTSLKHFIYFIQEFKLVQANDLKPMSDYINSLSNRDVSKE